MKTFNNKITLTLGADSEVIVKAFIDPIEYTLSNFHMEWDALADLKVAEPKKQYSALTFHAFLPNESVSVGDSWQIEQAGVLELLSQLHPSPRLDMHIDIGDSHGLWACLRAYNERFADIVFRVHAEFALTDGWFTPSQFAGHLLIDRIGEKVTFFKMHVPEGILNFDANWKLRTTSGFCPKIELCAGTDRVMQDTEFLEGPQQAGEGTSWQTESITQEQAEQALRLRFYKWQRIDWVPPDQALEMAQVQQKPIHAISLDGPLADEAC